jgi:hypothetical protein
VLTLVHAMVAGGDYIDDADVLRTGQTAAVLGHRVMAPSTLGTFLRSFTFLIRVGDIEPAFVCALTNTSDVLEDQFPYLRMVGAELDQHLGGDALALVDQAEQDVLGPDVVVVE